jgi:hypothetical protein
VPKTPTPHGMWTDGLAEAVGTAFGMLILTVAGWTKNNLLMANAAPVTDCLGDVVPYIQPRCTVVRQCLGDVVPCLVSLYSRRFAHKFGST